MKSSRIRIGSFRLRAYRSCRNASFDLDATLSALIGPNGSGKTNILQGLLLLRDLARRKSFFDVDDEAFTLKCKVDATFIADERPILYRATFVLKPTESSQDEVLSTKEQFNFRAFDSKDRWIDPWESIYLVHSGRISEPRYLLQSGRIYEPRYLRRLSFPPSSRDDPRRYIVRSKGLLSTKSAQLLSEIQAFRGRIEYYGASQFTNPTACPTSFEIDSTGELQHSPIRSQVHVRFMYNLYTAYKTAPNIYSRYMSLVGIDGLRLIDKIVWKSTLVASNTYEVHSGGRMVKKKRQRILIIPTIYSKRSQLSFNQLSEGTFRSLALLFYITTSPASLLLIEEPEVCVHHGLLSSFVEVIKQCSERKQIVVSTHSDYVIDKLKPENVFLVRNLSERGTIVRPISKALQRRQYAALKEYLNSAGNLGEYWRHSGFE